MLSKNKTIRCPACHGENSIDSRFCRNCGRPLVEDASIAPENLTSPAEIDARRARQLLERALHLAEKGDYTSATLACRQAVALDHEFFDGYAMLGSLLERQHDTKGAINAFERALQISPDSVLESESLMRLRASSTADGKGTGLFHFNQEELAPVVPAEEPVLANSEEEDEVLLPSFEEEGVPAIGVRLPPTSQSVGAASEETVVAETATLAELEPETGAATFAMPASGVGVNLPPSRPAAEIAEEESASHSSETQGKASKTLADVSAVTALASAAVAARDAGAQPATSADEESNEGTEGIDWAFNRPHFDESMFPTGPRTPLAAATATIPGMEEPIAEASSATPKAPVSLAAPLEIKATTHTVPLHPSDRHVTPVTPVIHRPASPRQKAEKDEPLRAPGILPVAFTFGTTPQAKLPWWAPMVRGNSFYGRTLPLVALAVLSLGFLSWARGHALSNQAEAAPIVDTQNVTNVQQSPVASTQQTNFVNPPASGTTTTNPATNTTASNPNQGGFIITNQPPTPATGAGGTTPATNQQNAETQSRTGTRTAPRAGGDTGGNNHNNQNSPQFPPVQPLAPANPSTMAPANPGNSTGNSGSSNFNLGAPRINQPAPAPTTVSVLPPALGGSSNNGDSMASNGSPVNPAGSSAAERGYIRITQGHIPASGAPARPENRARAEERAASNAARTGNADRAIDGFTTALNRNTPNAGYLFQQRAMAFMQRGDNSRAAEDFQSSISAYQDQINRGENAADARAGLRASRNGLNLALANNGQ